MICAQEPCNCHAKPQIYIILGELQDLKFGDRDRQQNSVTNPMKFGMNYLFWNTARRDKRSGAARRGRSNQVFIVNCSYFAPSAEGSKTGGNILSSLSVLSIE